MSEKDEKDTSELSMEELEKVAGGGANDPIGGVGIGLGNNKHKSDGGAASVGPSSTAVPTPATPGN